MLMHGNSSLSHMGDSMDVQVSIKDRIQKPVAEVFDTIVNPDKLSGFFVSSASGSIQEGAAITWYFADVGGQLSVTIKQVRRNALVSFEWAASGANALVNIILEAVDANTTSVKITEDGWPLDNEGVSRALRQTQGWTDFLCSMKAYLYTGINLRKGRTKDIH
jgi:uncharacterized protein YndB with AHSA1/START domain